MKWEDRLDIGGLSDVGMRRSNNQDSFRVLTAPTLEQWQSRGHFFVVADGMGAHAVGELASKMAVDTIPHSFHKLAHLPCTQAIEKAVQDANTLIHNRGAANREFHGMGTTSTALVLLPEGALVAHIGDSRAYRVRDGRIEQLSFDHSLAWELVRRKQLTAEQARATIPNNVITRSLGPEPEVQVDIEGPHAVRPGDVFVLCSDGLSGQVGDPEIGVIARYLPAQDACQYLVDMANLRGGPDNITLIIVRVEDPSERDSGKSSTSLATQPRAPRNYPKLLLTVGIVSFLGSLALGVASGFVVGNIGTAGLGFLAGVTSVGLVLAITGLVWRFLTRPAAEPSSTTEAAVYRHYPCDLDKAMLDRLIARLQQLRALAIEQTWNADWTEFFAHRNAADKHMESGDWIFALREFCLAQRLLAIAQRHHQEQTQSMLGGK